MKQARLQVFCWLLFLLLNYPIAALFDQPRRIWGIPLLYAYLFGVWLLFLLVFFLIVERAPKTENDPYE